MTHKSRFALFFGNCGFFPASLIASARQEMRCELNALGRYLDFDVALPQNGVM